MRFSPKTEKELAEANLWANGEYPFEIVKAEEATDKNGGDMFKLQVKVYDGERFQFIFDYVSPNWMEHKLRHLAESVGLLADYETGVMEAYQLEGKTGVAKVNVQKDKTGQYPDKNGIADYVVKRESMKAVAQPDDDFIPF